MLSPGAPTFASGDGPYVAGNAVKRLASAVLPEFESNGENQSTVEAPSRSATEEYDSYWRVERRDHEKLEESLARAKRARMAPDEADEPSHQNLGTGLSGVAPIEAKGVAPIEPKSVVEDENSVEVPQPQPMVGKPLEVAEPQPMVGKSVEVAEPKLMDGKSSGNEGSNTGGKDQHLDHSATQKGAQGEGLQEQGDASDPDSIPAGYSPSRVSHKSSRSEKFDKFYYWFLVGLTFERAPSSFQLYIWSG